jgi:hypothetical protein
MIRSSVRSDFDWNPLTLKWLIEEIAFHLLSPLNPPKGA